ncbi:MAG: ATP-dependent sacrificial sulfur transferase LarE [Eubacteriales bacterium]|nr:ATP-dependent sacrificial sulfur transferase LarE [Eubacteriales bacterium]
MDKWESFGRILARQNRLAVAFSGGTDSTLLLAMAQHILGKQNVLALTAHCAFISADDAQWVRRIQEQLGSNHLLVAVPVLENPRIVQNLADRCYDCKKEIFSALQRAAAQQGYDTIADGTNFSDRGDYRPGRRALEELGILSPFDEAGITKAEIREKARELDLPNWSRPAAACLASRVPYGTPLTPELLRRVDQMESALREQGFVQFRVRDHGDIARLEFQKEQMQRAVDMAQELVELGKASGYRYVTLDLCGYRMGSMNESLGEEQHGK